MAFSQDRVAEIVVYVDFWVCGVSGFLGLWCLLYSDVVFRSGFVGLWVYGVSGG